jgi:hypothetical protein
MAKGLTQSLTEMSTGNFLGGKGRPARSADNLIAICELIVYRQNVGASTSHNPIGLHRRPARRADNLIAICELMVYRQNVGASMSHNPIGLHSLLQG